MDASPIDPLELGADDSGLGDGGADHASARSRLNTRIAITVALLATFTGVCKVKDDNIVQAMQQAQADRVDDWSYYQAKNTREDVARAAADQLRALAAGTNAATADAARRSAARYDSVATNEDAKKADVRRRAEADQKAYDALNFRDDQFDLSDTLVAIAISMLAMTSLTQKRWLYAIALVFTVGGILMGMAGLFGWHLHPDLITGWLS